MLVNSGRNRGVLKLRLNGVLGEVSNIAPRSEMPEKQGFNDHGTGLAVEYTTSGVGPYFASGIGRGGARNHANRESEALTTAQIRHLQAAATHAQAIGLPLNRMITIHWEAAGVPLASMVWATGRYVDLLSRTLARHGSKTAWLWVHENAPGSGHAKGGHCHLLAHMPARLVSTVTGLQRGWLAHITGKPNRARVILSRPIGGKLGLEAGNPELHAINLDATLIYVIKGADPEAAEKLGMTRLAPGGRVIGKRCGTSQNIGRKARGTLP